MKNSVKLHYWTILKHKRDTRRIETSQTCETHIIWRYTNTYTVYDFRVEYLKVFIFSETNILI